MRNAFYGKVDPRRIDENVNAEHIWTGSQGATAVREFLASPSLYDKIESLKPARPKYDMLRKALAQYRQYEKAGGWGTIPSGKEVPAASVNWKRYTAENLPYKLRQDPGPDNALGAAKFMFPNPYHVYLHDTPNQLGYDRRLRAMSWGCIHVQDPLALLYWTVDIADDGEVVFYPDVYDRDGYVLRALNGPFKMRMIDRRN